jgi:HPt (histidine-containing phosphotransfer) domain-containing protein
LSRVEFLNPFVTIAFDPEALMRLERMGGKKVLLQLIGLFMENAPRHVSDACGGLEEGNLDTVRRAMHTLKTSAAYVGGTLLSQLARDLEHQSTNMTRDEVSDHLKKIEASLGDLIAELKRQSGVST